jgi:hypothetical protein
MGEDLSGMEISAPAAIQPSLTRRSDKSLSQVSSLARRLTAGALVVAQIAPLLDGEGLAPQCQDAGASGAPKTALILCIIALAASLPPPCDQDFSSPSPAKASIQTYATQASQAHATSIWVSSQNCPEGAPTHGAHHHDAVCLAETKIALPSSLVVTSDRTCLDASRLVAQARPGPPTPPPRPFSIERFTA